MRYAAPGGLDFGNSPRATPLIHGKLAILFGAFGHLHAVNLTTGEVLWKKDIRAIYGEPGELPWGHCGSPLIADDKLIINPGGSRAGIVAMNPQTGAEIWRSAGGPPSYGSLIVGTLGGVRQVVGHDATHLCGWDLATGKRLWTIKPPRAKDFNVPTPLLWNGFLVICTENNGTRMFRFRDGGAIEHQPVAVYRDLAPDTHTPVVVGNRLIGVFNGVHALDLNASLNRIWFGDEEAFSHYTTAIATDRRLLLITHQAEAVLIDPLADEFRVIGRKQLLEDETDFYAHAAVAGKRLYVRGGDAIFCLSLE